MQRYFEHYFRTIFFRLDFIISISFRYFKIIRLLLRKKLIFLSVDSCNRRDTSRIFLRIK